MLRFLVTDDDDVTHAYLRHVLLGLGDVSHAFSGREALEACTAAMEEGTPYDCVIMDVLMPGITGVETLAHIRRMHEAAETPAPKLVLMSCMPESDCLAQSGAPCQADRYICKPFDRRTMLTVLAGLGFGQPPAMERGEDFW